MSPQEISTKLAKEIPNSFGVFSVQISWVAGIGACPQPCTVRALVGEQVHSASEFSGLGSDIDTAAEALISHVTWYCQTLACFFE